MRTLLTGFGAFPGVADNPTARVARHLSARPGAEGLTARVLPVSFGETSRLLPNVLLGGEPFQIALLLGVAARDREFRLEPCARNRHGALTPDVDGFVAGEGPIAANAPEAYETRVPLGRLLERLRADGLPARVSEDAGGYVCNHAYYTALRAIHEAGLPTLCLFLHVPPVSDDVPLERHIAAVEAVLEELRSIAATDAGAHRTDTQEVLCSRD